MNEESDHGYRAGFHSQKGEAWELPLWQCFGGNFNSTSKDCHRVGGKLRAEKVRGLLELEI